MKIYMKWIPTQKKGMDIIKRLDRTKPRAGATLMDGFVGGYKTGYIVASRIKIRGWKEKQLSKNGSWWK